MVTTDTNVLHITYTGKQSRLAHNQDHAPLRLLSIKEVTFQHAHERIHI